MTYGHRECAASEVEVHLSFHVLDVVSVQKKKKTRFFIMGDIRECVLMSEKK